MRDNGDIANVTRETRMFAAGFNAKDTPVKQENLRRFLRWHMGFTAAVIARDKRNKPYLYIDANAGPGNYAAHNAPQVDGSPRIFLDLAATHLDGYEALFIERDHDEYERLCDNVGPWLSRKEGRETAVCGADANQIIGACNKEPYRYGLMYHDPNGKPDWDLLSLASERFPRVDILVNLSCTTIKRVRGAYGDDTPTLLDGLTRVGKKFVYHTAATHGRWQWLMAMLTNFEPRDWRSQGIIKYDDSMIKRLSKSKREMQPGFFS